MNGVSKPTMVMAGFSRIRGSSMRSSGFGIFGFGFAQQPIVIGVELLELLRRAEELAGRQLAVAVDIHVAEPALRRNFHNLVWPHDNATHPSTAGRLAPDKSDPQQAGKFLRFELAALV